MTVAGHGIPSAALSRILEVVRRTPGLDRVVLFGSRAKGTHRPGSDIDLALYGEDLDWRAIGRLSDALDDLLLPWRFSLIRHDPALDPDVAAHIERVGIAIFERTDAVQSCADSRQSRT